jgi:hypothetical protein
MLPDVAHRSQSQLVAEVLLNKGVLTRIQLQQAAADAKSARRSLGHSLVSLGLISEAALLKLLSAVYKVRSADVSRISRIPPSVLEALSASEAKHNLALPLRRNGGTLTVAVANPADLALLERLREASGLEIEPVVAPDFALFDAIKKYYKPEKTPGPATEAKPAPAEAKPGPAEAKPATAPPAAQPAQDAPADNTAPAPRSRSGLDSFRGMDLSSVFAGKGLFLAGVAMIVLGAIVMTLSYEPTGQDTSYFITTALLFVGIAAIMRGFFTLDD